MTNPLIAFLQENILRLTTKSPKFFKIWQIISGGLVAITGIPQLLEAMNIHLPSEWNNNVTIAIGWASRGMFLISLMTTQSKAVGVDVNGNILKSTNETKLPFTSQQEVKEVAKKSDTINELSVTGKVDIAPDIPKDKKETK